MSNLVRFVLTGPHKGKTKGFSRDLNGNHRYKFKNGVMEVHPTKVNGRFIKRMKEEYAAVLEGQENDDGVSDVSESGDNPVGSEEVHDDGLTKAQPSPASEAAIELKGDDDAEAGKKKQPAKRRKG